MIDVNIEALEKGMEATRTALRDGVLSINIWDKNTGLTLIDWQGNPTAVALFNQITVNLEETLTSSGFTELKDWYYMDLEDDKALVIIDHGESLVQGWLLDSKKTNTGILLGMAIPKAIASAKNAGKAGQSAKGDADVRLDLILQAQKVGLWDMIVDAGNPVSPKNAFTWTQEFRSMLGFSDESDFPNVLESWSNRLHPDHHGSTLDAFAAHLTDTTGETVYDVEYLLQLKSGEYRWYRATGQTTRDENGTPLRVVGVLKDIHDERMKSGNTEWLSRAAK